MLTMDKEFKKCERHPFLIYPFQDFKFRARGSRSISEVVVEAVLLSDLVPVPAVNQWVSSQLKT